MERDSGYIVSGGEQKGCMVVQRFHATKRRYWEQQIKWQNKKGIISVRKNHTPRHYEKQIIIVNKINGNQKTSQHASASGDTKGNEMGE